MTIIALLLHVALAGAPIPVDPHYVIVNAPRIVRTTGTCVPVVTQKKAYRCDTVFINGFQQP